MSKAKTGEQKYTLSVARVIINNGSKATLEFPDDKILNVYRGRDGVYVNLFAEDFLRILPVGRRVPVRCYGDAAWLPDLRDEACLEGVEKPS